MIATGHSIDTTLTDGCAWRRADTPTAAAALVTGLIAAAARTATADHVTITTAAAAVADARLILPPQLDRRARLQPGADRRHRGGQLLF